MLGSKHVLAITESLSLLALTDVRSLQELLPFYIKYYTHGVGRELLAELGSRSSYSSSTATSAQVASVNTHITADTEDNEHVDQVSHKAHVELKIPQLQG